MKKKMTSDGLVLVVVSWKHLCPLW